MMHAVHRYEGTVNQVLGDGIMALFGAPLAHEDHAVRACYAALAMQETMRRYTEEARHTHGVEMQLRVGLNSGAVVVRAIGDDLHMDYSAVGQTTHLAARMEQLAAPGSIRLTADTLRLAEGFIRVTALGLVPVKGLAEPVAVWELVGVTALRRRLQAAVARGLSPFVGRQPELETLFQALERAGAGQGQVVALLGEPGVGKSRLVYEFLHLGRVYYDMGDYARAIESLRQNVVTLQGDLLAERFGTNGSVAVASRASLSQCLAEFGAFTEGLAMAEEGLRIAETVNSPFSLIEACYGISMVYQRHGDVQALDLARQYKQRGHQSWALWLLGESTARQASPEVELAVGHYHQALAIAEELGMRPLQTHCHHGLGTLYARTGQRQQARVALAAAIALYRAMAMTFWLSQTQEALAQVSRAG
jgi:tetratricopeptide (TPR) repeat protein